MQAVREAPRDLGIAATCDALAVPRSTFYRIKQAEENPPEKQSRPTSHRALSEEERDKVLEVLRSERFADKAPRQVYATLLDEDIYHCSAKTMYRILQEVKEVRERRDQLRHPDYKKPELLATGPNQVWSWDITKMLGPVKWTYYYLYVILDIYSRYVVGWMVATEEAACLARRLVGETTEKQSIQPGQLAIHADRGSSMKSKLLAQKFADLGVLKSHSRPHVSNDNPYSEAQFKTLKYRPGYPKRFGSIEDARAYCQEFFAWYNTEHRHSGIGLLTPEVVHYKRTEEVLEARQGTLSRAYERHPERFVLREPKPQEVPNAVWINKPQAKQVEEEKVAVIG